MEKEGKEVEIALSTLHQKVNEVKGSLQMFIRKLEMGEVLWPDVQENFSTLSGQLNMLQKVLSKEKTPALQNLVLIPLLVGQGVDPTLEQLTEGRVPHLHSDLLPDYLRTKLDLEIEKKEAVISGKVTASSDHSVQQQISDLNNLSDSLTEIITSSRDSWEDTSLTGLQAPDDVKELAKLVGALETGKLLRIANRKINPAR